MDQADTTTKAEVFDDANRNLPNVLRVWADIMERELRPASMWNAAVEDMRIIADRFDALARAERDACKQIARQHEEASRELGFDGAANAAASIAEAITARGRGEAEPLLTPPASKG
jgi:hypothetical protein